MLKHARDFNLTRESVLGSQAGARDAGHRHPAGVRHRPAGRRSRSPNKIALGQIEAGIAGGTDTTSDAPVAISDKLRKKLMKVNAARDTRASSPRSAQIRPGDIGLAIPQNGEPRTGLSMGEHAALTALEWQIGREEQDELAAASHQHLAAAYDARLPRRPGHAVPRRSSATHNLRPDSTVEKLAKLKPVFGKGEAATMTAGNSTPLTDGASAVLLASEEWAAEHGLEPLAFLVDSRDRGRRLRARRRGPADGAGVRRPADARAQRPDACRTSTSTRSTRRSPRRCSRR